MTKFNPSSVPQEDRPTKVLLTKTTDSILLFSFIPSAKNGRLLLESIPVSSPKGKALASIRKHGSRIAKVWSIEFVDEID